jgi:hypothetical protein
MIIFFKYVRVGTISHPGYKSAQIPYSVVNAVDSVFDIHPFGAKVRALFNYLQNLIEILASFTLINMRPELRRGESPQLAAHQSGDCFTRILAIIIAALSNTLIQQRAEPVTYVQLELWLVGG